VQVLITGGAGFVGSHLVEEMLSDGHHVTVVDRTRGDRAERLAEASHPVRSCVTAIGSPQFRATLDEGRFDAVIHLAGTGEVARSVAHPSQDLNDSLVSGFDLLEWARVTGSGTRLLFASTASVYGQPVSLPIREEDPTVPISPYGVSKLALERYSTVYAKLYGVRTAALRFFSLYGPRQKKLVVYDLMRKFSARDDIPTILGDGSQVRDFCYIKDAVRAACLVCERGDLKGEVYNVGTGVGVSIRELVSRIRNLVAPGREYRFTGEVRSGDGQAWVADISKIAGLGYSPSTGLEDGLAQTADWFRTVVLEP